MFAAAIPWGKIILAVAFLGLVAAVAWYRHEATVARESAETAQAAVKIWRDSAESWQAAAGARDRAIADLQAQLQKITADAQEAELRAVELIEAAQARADTTESKLAQLRKQANEASEADKPRPLSPAARNGLEWLRCRAEAGTDPSTCR